MPNPYPSRPQQSTTANDPTVAFGGMSPQDVERLHDHSDKDSKDTALHHTIGTGPGQVSRGKHTHDGIDSPALSPVALGSAFPPGVILQWAGQFDNVPDGWLLCDGGWVSRTGATAALFAAIGTAYGAGDGSTNFAKPDFRARKPVGYTAGDTDYNAVGKTGGTKTSPHTHTSAAHSHALGDVGWAQITMNAGNPGFLIRRVAATAWAAALQFATPAPPTGGGGNQTLGAALDGNTGSTTPGATGSTAPDTTDPYVTVNFIIKT